MVIPTADSELSDVFVCSHETSKPKTTVLRRKCSFEMASFCVKHDWQAIISLKAAFLSSFAVLQSLFLFTILKHTPKTTFHYKASGILNKIYTKKKKHHDVESRPQSDRHLWGSAVHTQTFLSLIAGHLFIGCDCLKEWWACFARLLVLIPQETWARRIPSVSR